LINSHIWTLHIVILCSFFAIGLHFTFLLLNLKIVIYNRHLCDVGLFVL